MTRDQISTRGVRRRGAVTRRAGMSERSTAPPTPPQGGQQSGESDTVRKLRELTKAANARSEANRLSKGGK